MSLERTLMQSVHQDDAHLDTGILQSAYLATNPQKRQ